MVNDNEGQMEKGTREKFDSYTEGGDAISYDVVALNIAKEQYISDTEED
jgi:hypothetical protein